MSTLILILDSTINWVIIKIEDTIITCEVNLIVPNFGISQPLPKI